VTDVTLAAAAKANDPGRQVGGVTVDLVGNVYVQDSADFVWKLGPKETAANLSPVFLSAKVVPQTAQNQDS